MVERLSFHLIAAEQKARVPYDNTLWLAAGDPGKPY